MAINSNILTEIDIPETYIDDLPKLKFYCQVIDDSFKCDPIRQMSWNLSSNLISFLWKPIIAAESCRNRDDITSYKQRYPELSQTSLDTCKIQYNRMFNHMVPRSEVAPSQHGPVSESGGGVIGVSPVSLGMDGGEIKKKRGRPRKYGPDGSVSAMALSPLPISSSGPFSSEFSSGKQGKPKGMEFKQSKKVGVDLFGDSVGTNFMPHIITVNAGEDITMKRQS
ncbi:unnamed protein product [Lathyrus sativus]|nr:unnamed protein product [Lathyrus sativus]